MKKIIGVFLNVLLIFLLCSCVGKNANNQINNNEINNNEKYDLIINDNHIVDEKYINYASLKIVNKKIIDDQFIIEVLFLENFNKKLAIDNNYTNFIDLIINNNETVNLIINQSFYKMFEKNDEFVYQLKEIKKINDEYAFDTMKNDYTIALLDDNYLSFETNNLDADSAISIMKSFNYYYNCFCGELLVRRNFETFGFSNNKLNKKLFEVALFKHKDLKINELKWKPDVIGERIDLEMEVMNIYELLKKYNVFSNRDSYYKFNHNIDYDGNYLYLVLDVSETFSQIEVTDEFFKTDSFDFSSAIKSIKEIDEDKYAEIKKRLNGEEVSAEIMAIDLDDYHRDFIVEFQDDYNINNMPLIDISLKNVIYFGFDKFNFENSINSNANVDNFVKLKETEVISRLDNNILVSFDIIESYGAEKMNWNKKSVNLLIPYYIYNNIDDDFEFIYQLDSSQELLINNSSYEIYDVNNNLDRFVPIYNNYFMKLNDDTADALFNNWVESFNNNFYNYINFYFDQQQFVTEDNILVFNYLYDVRCFELIVELIQYETINNVKLSTKDLLLLSYLILGFDCFNY